MNEFNKNRETPFSEILAPVVDATREG